VLDWYGNNHFETPEAVLVDLEPSVDPAKARVAEQIRRGEIRPAHAPKQKQDIMSIVGGIIDAVDENVDQDRFDAASREFASMQDMMHERGTKAIAVALPLAYEDIHDGKLLLQQFMTCPVTSVGWDMINFMIFNVDYVVATNGLISNEAYRHLLYLYAKVFHKNGGPKKPPSAWARRCKGFKPCGSAW